MSQFEASKPIYMQIADQLYKQIIRQEINPGDKLPSVRDLAIELGVNPNTIQRSYSEMERLGIVETKRGQGTFIVEQQQIVVDLKQQLQNEIIHQFVKSMKELGFSQDDILAGLKQYLQRGGQDGD